MDLSKLFETQKKLDAEIEKKHPLLPGEDRLTKRILALQVELGECANEWRGFKFWSKDQTPRIAVWDEFANPMRGEGGKYKNLLLEEYVDCLHFILSIGLAIDEEYFYFDAKGKAKSSITEQFQEVFKYAYLITEDDYCSHLLTSFVYLGEMLGFTWEQVEEAYMSKNQTNWERQANGY